MKKDKEQREKRLSELEREWEDDDLDVGHLSDARWKKLATSPKSFLNPMYSKRETRDTPTPSTGG